MEPFTIHGVLSDDECEALVREAEAIGFTDAPITTAIGFVMRPDIRNNTRVILDDRPRAQRLWERVAPRIPTVHRHATVVGLNERFRFYRYREGQYFEWHRDGAFRRNAEESSMLTLLVYLNDDYLGGHTEFGDFQAAEPRRGMVLVFEHGLRHRGAPVLRGTKYVLRTDVMVRHVAARST